jgi:hypothetical protein
MKRKLISVVLLAAFLTSVYLGNISVAAASKVKVDVKLESVECVENNHVGNEWEYSCTANKKELKEGDTIQITTTSSGKIKIVAEATENDKYPDTGTKTLTIPVSKLKKDKNSAYTCNVTVIEDRGRYAGNTAVWKFTFNVKRK